MVTTFAEAGLGDLSEGTVQLLYFLLPGFLAAWVFYGLTAHPKKDQFERSIQALIFTVIVKAATTCLGKLFLFVGKSWSWGTWNKDTELIWSVVVALAVGVFFSAAANGGFIHRTLRKLKITERTSYPGEWFSVFHAYKRHCVLNLKNGRRLRGWPEEWPDQCDKGHFIMESPEWVLDNGHRVSLYPTMRILIAAEDVEYVEFEFDGGEDGLKNEERKTIQDGQKELTLLHEKPDNTPVDNSPKGVDDGK